METEYGLSLKLSFSWIFLAFLVCIKLSSLNEINGVDNERSISAIILNEINGVDNEESLCL